MKTIKTIRQVLAIVGIAKIKNTETTGTITNYRNLPNSKKQWYFEPKNKSIDSSWINQSELLFVK